MAKWDAAMAITAKNYKAEPRGSARNPLDVLVKAPHYTLGLHHEFEVGHKKLMGKLAGGTESGKQFAATRHGLTLKYPQPHMGEVTPQAEDGQGLLIRDPRYRISYQWGEVVRRAYKPKRWAQWWWPKRYFGREFS